MIPNIMKKIIKTKAGKINTQLRKDSVSFAIKEEGKKYLRLRYEKAGLGLKQNAKIADLPDNPFVLAKRIFGKVAQKEDISVGHPIQIPTKGGVAEVKLHDNSFTIIVRRDGQTNAYITSRNHGVYEDVTQNKCRALKAQITAIENAI